MTDYTPTMARIEDMYAWAYAWRTQDDPGDGETDLSHLREAQRAEFQRALADHSRQIKAEAWDEGWEACLDCVVDGPDWGQAPPNPYRADRIEQGVEKGACQHEGGTGCPETRGGAHYYAYLDSTERRTCIDCGTPEAPTREDQS